MRTLIPALAFKSQTVGWKLCQPVALRPGEMASELVNLHCEEIFLCPNVRPDGAIQGAQIEISLKSVIEPQPYDTEHQRLGTFDQRECRSAAL
jgi:hypothetical protein